MPERLQAFVAVTDNDWFRFLSAREGLDEVNFWQRGGGRDFRALSILLAPTRQIAPLAPHCCLA